MWDLDGRSLFFVNRGLVPLAPLFDLTLVVISLGGHVVDSAQYRVRVSHPHGPHPDSSSPVEHTDGRPVTVAWPEGMQVGQVLLFRFTVRLIANGSQSRGPVVAANEYFQSRFVPGQTRCTTEGGQHRQDYRTIDSGER